MARRRVLRFIGVYTLLGFVPLAVSFFLLPVYATHLSPDQYGVLTSANVSLTFATLFMTLGIDGAIGVFYFDCDTDAKRYALLGTALCGMAALSLALAGLLAVAGRPLFELLWTDLDFSTYGWFIVLAAITQVAYGVIFAWHRTRESLWMAAGTAIGTTVCSLLGSVVAIVYVRPDALGALVGKTVGSTIGIAPFALLLLLKLPRRVDVPLLKRLFAYGLPASAYTILLYLLFNGDRVVMQRWFTTTDLGLYSLAATLILPIEVVLQAGQNAVQPMLYRKLADKSPEVGAQIGDFYFAVMLLNVVGLVFAVLLAEPVLRLFKGAKYLGSDHFVAVLAYSQMFRVLYNAYAFTIFFAKHTIPFPPIAVVSIVGGLAGAWAASSVLGPLGVGVGVAAYKLTQALATRWAMKRYETVQVEMSRGVPWMIAAGAWVIGLYVLRARGRESVAMAFELGGLVLVAAAGVAGLRLARSMGLFARGAT